MFRILITLMLTSVAFGEGPQIAADLPNSYGVLNGCRPERNRELCNGIWADNTGHEDASEAINECLKRLTPNSTLSLVPGVYRLKSSLSIVREGITITTENTAQSKVGCLQKGGPNCACLVADPRFSTQNVNGLVSIGAAHAGIAFEKTNRAGLKHIVLHGNGWYRRRTNSRNSCTGERYDGLGTNLVEYGGDSNRFVYSASVDALCRTSVSWATGSPSTNSIIMDNKIAFNGLGYDTAQRWWVDGLRVYKFNNANLIANNLFFDNTGISLNLGGAKSDGINFTRVTKNRIIQRNLSALVGVNLNNFAATTARNPEQADYGGLKFTENTIDCKNRCDIAFNAGILIQRRPLNWYSFQLLGGEVSRNVISGDKQVVNFGAAGDVNHPLRFYGNQLLGQMRFSSMFVGNQFQTSVWNQNASDYENVLDTNGPTAEPNRPVAQPDMKKTFYRIIP